MNTALAIGVGALAIFVVWKLANAPTAAAAPPKAPSLPGTVQGILQTAITNPNVINHAIFGVGTDSFATFGDLNDFAALKQHMCNCYHGNTSACAAALEQAPGLRTCKPGDCDCNPTSPVTGTVFYRDSHGGPYATPYGRKVPVGGCRSGSPAALDNIAHGFCEGLT